MWKLRYIYVYIYLASSTWILEFCLFCLPSFYPLLASPEMGGEKKKAEKHPVLPPFCGWTERDQAPGGGHIPESTSIRLFQWLHHLPRHNGNCRWLLVIYRAGVMSGTSRVTGAAVGKSGGCGGWLVLEAGSRGRTRGRACHPSRGYGSASPRSPGMTQLHVQSMWLTQIQLPARQAQPKP